MNKIKVIIMDGMVNIESNDVNYSNIRNMYKTGNGEGVQITEKLENKEDEIIDICSSISEKIYKLQDIIGKE